jgi:hypothetical protein
MRSPPAGTFLAVAPLSLAPGAGGGAPPPPENPPRLAAYVELVVRERAKRRGGARSALLEAGRLVPKPGGG